MKILIGGLWQFLGIKGGIERVIVNFSNEMCRRGHDVAILYGTEVQGKSPYCLDAKVRLVNLAHWIPNNDFDFDFKKKSILFKTRREIIRIFNKENAKNENIRFIINRLKNTVEKMLQEEKPDILITTRFQSTAVLISAAEKQDIPLITMTHIDAGSIIPGISGIEKKYVDNCDALQVLMPQDQDIFRCVFSNVPIVWIPNVVPQYELSNEHRERLIINVARLVKGQKRQYLLIDAFSKVAKQFPEWHVEFWGSENGSLDGKYATELKTLIDEYHLNDQVKLCGNTDDVLSVYRRASIFAFPSSCEGFPLAMTEAMSAGLPVVAYRSCPAVNELVRDGETGLLVDDGVDALAEGLKKLMEDQEPRERMGRAAHESMKEFAPEKIWDQWEALMQAVIAKHKAKMEH